MLSYYRLLSVINKRFNKVIPGILLKIPFHMIRGPKYCISGNLSHKLCNLLFFIALVPSIQTMCHVNFVVPDRSSGPRANPLNILMVAYHHTDLAIIIYFQFRSAKTPFELIVIIVFLLVDSNNFQNNLVNYSKSPYSDK